MLPPCLVCRVLFPCMRESARRAFQMGDRLSFQHLVLKRIQLSFQRVPQDNTIQNYILNSLKAPHRGYTKSYTETGIKQD